MLSSFNKLLSYTTLGLKESKSSNFVERDELSKNPPLKKAKKGGGDFLEPLLSDEKKKSIQEKGVIRVKVKMTKQEAARLMSKCKDGGILEFRDVAQEFANLPVNRVTVLPCTSTTSTFGVLKPIPEEN